MGVHMSIDDHEQIWILVEASESDADMGKAIGGALTMSERGRAVRNQRVMRSGCAL